MGELEFSDLFASKSRNFWTDEEVRILLRAWKQHHHVLRSIKKFHPKTPLHLAITKEIQRNGHYRTVKETSIKMKNIVSFYKREKEKKEESGALASSWKFYDAVEEIILLDEELERSRAKSKGRAKYPKRNRSDLNDHEEISSASANIIKLSIPSEATDYESDAPSLSEDNHFVPKVPSQSPRKVFLVNNGRASPSISSKSILFGFFKEFRRANRQLERNDAIMLKLFKENNEIFKQQNELIAMMLRK